METVAPPGVDALLSRMQVAERVGKTSLQQSRHLVALLVGEARILSVSLGILEVYLIVCHIHIATHHHRLAAVQPLQVASEVILPPHAVVQPAKSVLAVGRIYTHEEEVVHLQRNHSALVVMLVDAHPVGDCQRLHAAVDGRSAVALLVGEVPPRAVSRELQVQLTRLHLGLLQAEEVGIKRLEDFTEILPHYGTQAIHVPANQFHILFLEFHIDVHSGRTAPQCLIVPSPQRPGRPLPPHCQALHRAAAARRQS